MDKKYLHSFLIGIFFVVCLFISFSIGQSFPKYKEDIKIVRDTCIIRDTLIIKEPIETIRYKDKLVYIPINNNDTIYRNDTTYLAMQSEIVEYEDEEYKAIISGIYPKLEEISVYPKTVYITETQNKILKKHWSFNITAGPGIFYNKNINYGVGVLFGFGYNF